MIRVFFRVDASLSIGYGHLNRCICIANYFREKGIDCIFLIKESKNDVEKNISVDHKFRFLRLKSEEDLIQLAKIYKPEVIVTDVNTKSIFNTDSSYSNFSSILALCKRQIIVSFEEFQEAFYSSDIVVIPYMGASKLFKNYKIFDNYLLGERYFIYRNEFINSPKAVIREDVKNAFICMGGSDPNKLTEKCIKLLIKGKFNFKVKLFFSLIVEERKSAILNLLSLYQGGGELIVNECNISKEMRSSDIGIINSGLIKYETSIIGLPCISICNGIEHELVMKYFEDESSILHLSSIDDQDGDTFIRMVEQLSSDFSLRKKMHKNNIALFDGYGLSRLYERIIPLIKKT